VPEWTTAVLYAGVSTIMTLIVTGITSCRIASAKKRLVRRRVTRVIRRDVALIEEHFDNATAPGARARLQDLANPEIEDLVLSTEDLWPNLSEALAEYRDTLTRFKRAPYMIFGQDSDPKGTALSIINAANRALAVAGLPPVELAPWRPSHPHPS